MCQAKHPKYLAKLTTIICEHKPDRLVILGDVKYTVVSHEFGEWQDIPDFFKKLQEIIGNIAIVRGNHDANLEPLLQEKHSASACDGDSNRECRGFSWSQMAFAGAFGL